MKKKATEEQKAKRKAKRKAKDKAERDSREIKMMEHLAKNGWKRCGPTKDVWFIESWHEGCNDNCYMSLYGAYKNQLKLDNRGYERPVGMDDDLMSDIQT